MSTDKLKPAVSGLVLTALVILCLRIYVRQEKKSAMESVLKQTVQACRQKNTEAIIESMKKIDLSSCPVDFRQAFRKHLEYREGYLKVENAARLWKQAYQSTEVALTSFLLGMMMDFSLPRQSQEQWKTIQEADLVIRQHIKDSYRALLNIAELQGIDITPYQ